MSVRTFTQPRWLLSTLLLAGAALFTAGVAAERHASEHHSESSTETATSQAPITSPPSTTAGGDSDGGETSHTEAAGGHADGGESTQTGGEAAEHSETSAETVLGVDLESNGLVAVAIIAALVLAVLTWLYSRRSVLLVTLAFAVVFVVFDVAEIAHQLNESRAGLAVLAAAIAVVHLMTAVVAQQRASTDQP